MDNAKVLRYDMENDIAILKTDHLLIDTPLNFKSQHGWLSTEHEQEFFSVGFPEGDPQIKLRLKPSKRFHQRTGKERLYFYELRPVMSDNIDDYRGLSGSPVIDHNYIVYGILTEIMNGYNRLLGLIPITKEYYRMSPSAMDLYYLIFLPQTAMGHIICDYKGGEKQSECLMRGWNKFKAGELPMKESIIDLLEDKL